MRRDRGSHFATFGLTLSVLLCVAAVSQGSPTNANRALRHLERAELSAQDEEAVACLLAELHESAREHERQQQRHASHADAPMLGPITAGLPRLDVFSPPAPSLPPRFPVVLSRLNLPPPAIR